MQINRLFEIIYILLDKKSIVAKDLAKHFEVSTRTIYRDVETLSSAGIPIYMSQGKGGGISLLPGFVLNKALLTEGEKEDILTSLNAVNALSFNEADKTVKKLSSILGIDSADWVEVDFSSWVNGNEESETFNSFKSAIISKKIVEFSYSNGKGETATRKVEPLKLCFKGHSWYLYGYCTWKEDFRFFKLRRIKNLTVLNHLFTRVVPQNIFNDSYDFNEELETITLKLSKEMAFRVYDEFEEYEQMKDGSFIAKLMMPRGEWLFHYLFTFGENCEILEPEDLRVEIKELIKRMLKRY